MDSIEIIVTNSDSISVIPTTTHYQSAPNSAVTNTTKSQLDFKFNAEKTNGSKSKVNHFDGRYDDGEFGESKKPLLSLPTSLSSSSLNSPKKVKALATSSSQLPLPSHSIGIYDPFLKMS